LGLLVVARRQAAGVAQVAGLLLALEVAQGAVGFTQYVLDLPEALVAVHMLGAALTSAGITRLVLRARG